MSHLSRNRYADSIEEPFSPIEQDISDRQIVENLNITIINENINELQNNENIDELQVEEEDDQWSELDDNDEEEASDTRQSYDLCRLCVELTNLNYQINYSDFSLPYDKFYVEPSPCKCDPRLNRIHVLCLQRWLRFTADRPCSQCRTRFIAPKHIRRNILSFWDVLHDQYYNYYLISWLFLNFYLTINQFWLILRSEANVNDQIDWGQAGRVLDTLATIQHILVVFIPLNLILLGCFRLFFLLTNPFDSGISFYYRIGGIESTQIYTLEMVARFQLPQPHRRHVNLGQLYHVCSYCGLRLNQAHHVRYCCECYGIHRRCLLQEFNEVSGALACRNCGHLLMIPSIFQLVMLLLRDMLTRTGSEALQAWDYLINFSTIKFFEVSPCFLKYLFTTRSGLSTLLPFLLSTSLYVNFECTPHSRWYWSCSSEYLDLTKLNSSVFQNLVCLELPVWTLVWICVEFTISVYQQYLNDLIENRDQLETKLIYIDYPDIEHDEFTI